MRRIASILLSTAVLAHGACVPVEGDRIHGRDLAATHPRFRDIDKNADLGPAPAIGAQRRFRYFELERLARGIGVQLEDSDAREACFERAFSRLSEETLQSLFTTALAQRPGFENAQIEIVDFSRQTLPMGKPEFELDRLDRSGFWRGRMVYGDNLSVPIWARVRVTDNSGRALVMAKTSQQPEIARGDSVHVEISAGAVLLAFDAAAESPGHIGEQVIVRNPVNGQRFRAVVEARGRVGIRK